MRLRYQHEAFSDGSPWTACVATSTSGQHSSSRRGNGSVRASSRNASTVVYGRKKNGQSCSKCIEQGGFCHRHIHQKNDPLPAQVVGNPHSRSTSSSNCRTQTFRVFGITKEGVACRRCMMQDKFCWQHVSQDPSFAHDSRGRNIRTAVRSNEPRSQYDSGRTYGITNKGEPCKNCIKQNKFCHQHISQSQSISYTNDSGMRLSARSQKSTKSSDAYSAAPNSRSVHSTSRKEPRMQSSTRHEKARRSTVSRETADETKECAICMENIHSHQRHKKLHCCRNTFHKDCLRQWSFSGSTCPMCREPLE